MCRKKKKNLRIASLNSYSESLNTQQTKKNFHPKDLCNIIPLSEKQKIFFDIYKNDNSMLLHGTAGTGKTYISMRLILDEVLDNTTYYDKMVIIRSNVATRDVGFLKGTLEEKIAVFESPYAQICDRLFKYSNTYENLKKINKIQFMSSSYLRGMTFDNSIILVDECQNLSDMEFNTILTRIGEHSKIILCGDTMQKDLKNSAIDIHRKIFDNMGLLETIEFGIDDIVRSKFVKSYIIAREKILNK